MTPQEPMTREQAADRLRWYVEQLRAMETLSTAAGLTQKSL
jgi:hypothetical protein